jgi:hypothetical protein
MSEVLTVTAHRLIRWGMSEGQAHLLAKHMILTANTTDSLVEDAVIRVLCKIKESVSGRVSVEHVSGQRRDDLRDRCGILRESLSEKPVRAVIGNRLAP